MSFKTWAFKNELTPLMCQEHMHYPVCPDWQDILTFDVTFILQELLCEELRNWDPQCIIQACTVDINLLTFMFQCIKL